MELITFWPQLFFYMKKPSLLAEVPIYPSGFEWTVAMAFEIFWVYVGRRLISIISTPLLRGGVPLCYYVFRINCGDLFVLPLPLWKMVHMRKVIPKSDMYKAAVCSPSCPSWLVKSQVFVGNISISGWNPLTTGPQRSSNIPEINKLYVAWACNLSRFDLGKVWQIASAASECQLTATNGRRSFLTIYRETKIVYRSLRLPARLARWHTTWACSKHADYTYHQNPPIDISSRRHSMICIMQGSGCLHAAAMLPDMPQILSTCPANAQMPVASFKYS